MTGEKLDIRKNLIFILLGSQAVVGDIVLKLKALVSSMSKLNVRKEKCEIRLDMIG